MSGSHGKQSFGRKVGLTLESARLHLVEETWHDLWIQFTSRDILQASLYTVSLYTTGLIVYRRYVGFMIYFRSCDILQVSLYTTGL